jgi:integrase
MRKRLTDANVHSLKAKAKRYLVYDTAAPGFGVRVSPRGRKTFVLVARFDGKHPARRSLGVFGKISLEDAREKARDHLKLLSRGQRTSSQTFGEIAEQYLRHIQGQKRARDVECGVRRELISRWRNKPISDVHRADVLKVVDAAMSRGAPYAAHHAWAYCRRIFNWAIARGIVDRSPCDRVRTRDIIGVKVPRHRVLDDDELRRLWKASNTLGYPMGPLFQFLLVTGQRKSEVSNARWIEFDLAQQLWRVPSSRMKAGAPHVVPLSPLAITILKSLPQHTGYLFSTTGGKSPVNGFSKAKRRLDATMGQREPYVIHDIRRTVRTRLSALRVRTEVAEMVIGHGKKGLARVYDQHQYLDEMREALDLWASAVSRLVSEAAVGVASGDLVGT